LAQAEKVWVPERLNWRWQSNVRSLLSFVMPMPPRNWRNKAYRFLQATPVMPADACRAAGPDALIISTMGGAQDYLAHRTVIDEAEKAGISRMILVTSLGCGDSWPFLSERAKAAFGQAVREKTLAESWLQTSQLDYAILRPGGLLDGAATGKAQRIQNQECHGFVHRADVAAHIHELANAPALNQQVYSLIEPDLKPA
jgi:uncharacterized protein YbjT (DUF2867 family)